MAIAIEQKLVTVFFFTCPESGEVREFLSEQEAKEAATQAEFAGEINAEVTAYLNKNELFGRRRAGAETLARSISAFLKTYNGEVYEFDFEAAEAEAKAAADAAKTAEAPVVEEAPVEAGVADELG